MLACAGWAWLVYCACARGGVSIKEKTTKTDTALTAMNTRDWYMLYYTMHTVQGILNKVLHDALLQLLYIL